TADATLWFVHAVARHVAVAGDTDLAAELLPALEAVIAAHTAGTRYGIRVRDHLLRQGAPGEALTWMDARVDGVPVTPRRGAAVEINALWVNALAAMAQLRERTGGDGDPWWRRHASARAAFRRAFPAPGGGLQDTLGSTSVRPNQLFAYALPHAPMEPDPELLGRLGELLLAPLGLRSLA